MKLLLAACFFSFSLLAMPENFEVWFLSPEKEAVRFLPNGLKEPFQLFGKFAQNNLQCHPMGEFCFDPQVGMYKLDDQKKIEAASDYAAADKLENYDYARKALGKEREKSECDGDSFFDIFCSKGAAAKKKPTMLELWVDASSSMKQVDFPGHDKMCKREAFLRRLAKDCGLHQEMDVHVFNEVKKQLGSFDQACLNVGLNNRDRIIDAIKTSQAKTLIVITDIYEADETLIDFVEMSGRGSIKGLEKPMYASQLNDQSKKLASLCQK